MLFTKVNVCISHKDAITLDFIQILNARTYPAFNKTVQS